MDDVINFNSGDLDFTAPPPVVEAAVEAIREGRTRYAHGGLPELRAAVARKLALDNGVTVDPDTQVIITNGAAEASTVVFQSLLAPGDEVLTTDPYYGGHVGAILTARGVPVFVPTGKEDAWEVDPNEVERRITVRTKAFICANPGNPTGVVLREQTLKRLLEVAHERNIILVFDELFERYVYGGLRHISAASFEGAGNRVITINGFSKSYCMTGWRLGWIAAPSWLAGHLAKMRYAISMVSPTASQWAALAALSEAARSYYERIYWILDERRIGFFGAVTRMGLPQQVPNGTYIGLLDVKPLGLSAIDVTRVFLREARVLVSPGSDFGTQAAGTVRIGLVHPAATLQEATRRLEPVVSRLLQAAGGA
ncbi:MAG: pyridoxal phosphate-dependent aminotransferase [bacterium]|nr:pyridoxal phosphate-dependent aminotransferase [bacterium]